MEKSEGWQGVIFRDFSERIFLVCVYVSTDFVVIVFSFFLGQLVCPVRDRYILVQPQRMILQIRLLLSRFFHT